MTTRLYSSISQETTLVSAINASQTTMVVNSASAILSSSITPASGQTFTVVIDPDTSIEEIVDVVYPSSPSSNTLTIVRGIANSGTGVAHSAGAKIRHMATGRDFTEANNHIEASSAVHGLSGTVVGTTDTQTLTNKTLTSPIITTPTISSLTLGDGNIVFEGATADSYETTLTVAEPTADRTVTIPDATTTLVGTDTTQTLTNKTLTSPKINENVAVTATATELNILDGVTASTAELNLLDGVTSTTAELNILDGVTSTAAELNILDGATLSTAELNYVDGVTSAIQTQLDAKSPIANPTFTGTVTLPSGTVTSDMIANGTIVDADINSSAAITATKISGTAVTQADTGTVTSTMIANGTIVNADINASAAIAKTKLDLGGTITSADLVDGTIVASDIADGTITAAKMVSDPYARANHTGSQAASTISDLASTVKAYTLDEFADPAAAISMNSQKITSLATPTSNADAATKLYVDTKVADLVNSAPSTLDTLGEIASAIQSGGTVYESFVLKAGSTMTGALTLSGAPTVDLHAATKAYVDTVAGSATAAAASAAAAAASYDSFDDRYLGAKSSAPSVDNDGNALVTGAIYWNSSTNQMFAWTGSAWGSISSTADIYRFRFTASGGETSLSGTDANGLTLSYIAGKEQVYLNGVLLARTSDYTATDGSSITSLAALAANDIVEIITFTAFELADSIARSVFDAKGDIIAATSADTPGKLAVGSNGQVLMADSSTATGLKWSAYDPLPSQSGNSGKFLTTNGTATSWGTVSTDPIPQILMLGGM